MVVTIFITEAFQTDFSAGPQQSEAAQKRVEKASLQAQVNKETRERRKVLDIAEAASTFDGNDGEFVLVLRVTGHKDHRKAGHR
ncbi:hypothetical protein E4U51_003187 [Claviceps purpurea]|nr:hypothetical protein E4U51_003187 [Claviceps purpurea]